MLISNEVKSRFREFIATKKGIQSWSMVDEHFIVYVYKKIFGTYESKIPDNFEGFKIEIRRSGKTEFL